MGITATERNNMLDNINRTRTKWGLGSAGSNISAGTIASATNDVNNLLVWLREAKNKSGSPQTVMENISSGTILTNLYPTITSQSNNIYNYCKCHGNCSGSCTGSCTGNCVGTCKGRCDDYCRDNCSGCGSGCSST